ncbi:Putative ankyrin repeat protein [Fulvia fulva]|uniref:Ankyrin repeat protein n=1 Tax=Passalora fulva TaxID=5499 RepID=A0A9Q8L878_PASFU|nr:Putative ankyrin repeat protein [Fulvia fulva]KAK4635678.1 putative ankyrin repeat protein [Fulvia fulva]KAK4636611.1 putative ankyrin repeat protein [Fulvia fulva]UJO12582.1 Putative ankyrin repeat protein [Fulvia fulva]WPV09293.1 Putative ankyrin repeat protein [Fulvia fulva]WPV23291.1 Putative ankyrin repeat protein [Fulvia fulva]
MAELQTIAAVFDLLKVSYEAGRFLKKVKDADKIAAEISDRIERLESVLKSVEAVLKARDDHAVSSGDDAQVAERIKRSVLACTKTLKDLRTKLGGFDAAASRDRDLIERVKIAFRQPSINRINTELEARVQTLSTDLSVLQLFDQTKSKSALDDNHETVLEAISKLGTQLEEGNKLLSKLLAAQDNVASQQPPPSRVPAAASTLPNNDAIASLEDTLRGAEGVHEHFTSEYTADARSERIKRDDAEQNGLPLNGITPSIPVITTSSDAFSVSSDPASSNQEEATDPILDEDNEDDEEVWPLEILDRHISAYIDRSVKDRDAGNLNQAEVNLKHAISSSETRESRYGVLFVERIQLQEDMASLYQHQKKWAEAVKTVHHLLRERSSSDASGNSQAAGSVGLVEARQHQHLASIYYERHYSESTGGLSLTTEDIEKAESHARKAFNKQWKVFKGRDKSPDEAAQHNACITILVRILETRDKTVEANEMRKLLIKGSSMASDSLRRISTTHAPVQRECTAADKHDTLIEAIKSGNIEQIQTSLDADDLNLEHFDRQGKTFLVHAVESKDEATVHKLLDPEVGASVHTANRRGLTALHFAAMGGFHDMTRCLLHHDAEIEPRDKKGETPIIKAVLAGDTKMVQILADTLEDSLMTKGGDEWSVLHYAVQKPNREMIDLLLELAPDLKDAVDQRGQTALHHCADFERLEQVHALLEHEHALDVNATDSVSRSPLYLAATKPPTPRRENVVRILLRKGARLDEHRPPPRMRDYKLGTSRRDSTLSRTSVSTSGTFGTTSTSRSKVSRIAGRLGLR